MNTHIYLIELTEKLKYTSYTNHLPTKRNTNGYQRTSQKSKKNIYKFPRTQINLK